MENKEEILKKIDKLLALAGNNPNENEAISAALKAQELMAKYNIELADVQGAESGQKIKKEIYTPKKSSHYVSKWKYSLSQIIAKNFCCKTYSLGRDAIVFYGYEKDAKIANQVFGFLFETGNKLADRYYRKCKKEGRETKGNKPDCRGSDGTETHTVRVREWLESFGIPVKDEFFIKWQRIVMDMGSIFREIEKKVSDETMEMLWTAAFVGLYLHYQTELDFMSQFEENAQKFIALLHAGSGDV